jgi:hypothetical protein
MGNDYASTKSKHEKRARPVTGTIVTWIFQEIPSANRSADVLQFPKSICNDPVPLHGPNARVLEVLGKAHSNMVLLCLLLTTVAMAQWHSVAIHRRLPGRSI